MVVRKPVHACNSLSPLCYLSPAPLRRRSPNNRKPLQGHATDDTARLSGVDPAS
ncbi:MAG: hypothetical protein OXG81_16700 [Acidobacteria bacterium]|nr:hypothetical protein [Acidobacteriota bacterium]